MSKKSKLSSSKDTLEFLEELLDNIESGDKDQKQIANSLKAVSIATNIRKMQQYEKLRLGDKTPLWWLWDDNQPAQTLIEGDSKKKKDTKPIEFFNGDLKSLDKAKPDTLKMEISFNKSTQTWMGHFKEYPTVKAYGVTEDECRENLARKLAAHLKE